MKILTPNTLAPIKGRNTVSRIAISRSGMFTISTGAAHVMGLVPGDRLQFIEEGEKKEDDIFIVPIGKSGDGFEVRKHVKNEFYLFSSMALRNQILEHFFPGKHFNTTVKFLLGAENKISLEEEVEKNKPKKKVVRAWPLLPTPIL